MKVATVQLILLLSVLSLFISLLVNWQNYPWQNHASDHTNQLIVPILLSVLTCHQTLSDYNLLRNVVFGSVLLFNSKGVLSNNNPQPNHEKLNIVPMRNLFAKQKRETVISLTKKHVRPKIPDNGNSKTETKDENTAKRKSLLGKGKGKKKSSIKELSRKEELSNRILEEIEALDPLKCLPKALCSLSAQSTDSETDSNAVDSSQGQTEQKRKNNNVVNEYLDLMQTIITMEPRKKRQEKKRKFVLGKAQLDKPPSEDTVEENNEEEEEDDGENENEEDEESQEEETKHEPQNQHQNQRQPQRSNFDHKTQRIPSTHGMDKFDKQYYQERYKIHSLLRATENPMEWGMDGEDDMDDPAFVTKGTRRPNRLRSGNIHGQGHGHHGYGQGHGHGHNGYGHGGHEPTSYSQQYHYMSAPGPPGYYGGPHDEDHDHDHHKHTSLVSLLFSFIPKFIKKIIDIFIPTFTFEKKVVVGDRPQNLFSEDSFYDGFRRRNGHALNHEDEDRAFHPNNKMRPPIQRSLDPIMVDARERFAGAIEIGETFRDLRKCEAVYVTCPFKHTQIVTMIDVLKKKLLIQDIVDRRIANAANKHKNNQQTILKKKDDDASEELNFIPEKSNTKLTRRKSGSSSEHAYTRDSISFSHDKNFKRKPLVIRNINKILRPGSAPSSDFPHGDNPGGGSGGDSRPTGTGQGHLSSEYSDDTRESEEELIAALNPRAPETLKKSRKSNSKSKKDKKPISPATDTPSSIFQSLLSFF